MQSLNWHVEEALLNSRTKLGEQLHMLQQQHDEAAKRAQQLESWESEVKILKVKYAVLAPSMDLKPYLHMFLQI